MRFRPLLCSLVGVFVLGQMLSGCSKTSDGMQASCGGDDGNRVLRGMAVDPTDDRVVYVGVEGKGVFKTTNSGQTWTRISTGIQGAQLADGSYCYNEFRDMSIAEQNPQKICVSQSAGPFSPTEASFGVRMGPYCSSDGGASWTRGVTGLRDVGGYSIKIDPNNSSTVYYGVGDDVYNQVATASTGVIYRSTDFGQTWTELNTNYVLGQSANRLEVDPSNANKVYSAMAILVKPGTGVNGSRFSATQYGMLISNDAGSTFVSASNGMASDTPAQKAIVDLTLSRGNPAHLFVISSEDTATIRNYYTTDSGATFTASNSSQIDYAEFDPNDPGGNRLLGVSYGNIVRSTDGGVNWSPYGTTPSLPSGAKISVLRWSRQSASIVYLGADKASVFRSADGGLTWTQILSLATLPN